MLVDHFLICNEFNVNLTFTNSDSNMVDCTHICKYTIHDVWEKDTFIVCSATVTIHTYFYIQFVRSLLLLSVESIFIHQCSSQTICYVLPVTL